MDIPAREIVEGDDGRLYMRLSDPDDDWIELGICPRPRTVWQTFWYHVCHGLLMHYPLLDVLVFSWRNRRDFADELPDVDAENPDVWTKPYREWRRR